MRVTLFTREYPPNVYGGAGVHATYLARELSRLVPVEVRAFEGPRGRPSAGEGSRAIGFEPWSILAGPEAYRPALEVISVDLAMVIGLEGTAVVHSHTWYANLAGHLAKLTLRDPARHDHAQPRTAPALEGDPTGRGRLRAVELLRTDRDRGRRHRDRGVGGDA